jgi:hypothetical protein
MISWCRNHNLTKVHLSQALVIDEEGKRHWSLTMARGAKGHPLTF